jgi:hypothetical protein
MKKYVLVTYLFDYSDEFDVQGFWITEAKKHQASMAELKSNWPEGKLIDKYFGTNEAIYFESFEDYESGLAVKEIDEAQYEAIRKAFGSRHFGVGSFSVDDMLDRLY